MCMGYILWCCAIATLYTTIPRLYSGRSWLHIGLIKTVSLYKTIWGIGSSFQPQRDISQILRTLCTNFILPRVCVVFQLIHRYFFLYLASIAIQLFFFFISQIIFKYFDRVFLNLVFNFKSLFKSPYELIRDNTWIDSKSSLRNWNARIDFDNLEVLLMRFQRSLN